MRYLALLLFVFCGATAAGGQQADPGAASSRAAQPVPRLAGAPDGEVDPLTLWTGGRYRITQSDVLELHFPYVAEFDQTVTVQPDGYVSLRGIGDVHIQGRSLPELKALLTDAYAVILREPVINIVLKEFEKPYFVVAGEVARPGKFELRGATSLTQGLVLAGGETGAAKHSQVILFRRFVGEWLEVKEVNVKRMYASRDLSEDPLLRPGDTVFVPKSALAKIAPFIPRPGLGLYLNPFQ
ncbi:MAG TPA: polysaccharide biosynthesis/export family protein [Vicinamibacterales bacterium]|jgi:polysaccharide export outer membrane protein|nr:polysaccharide biosynthesis/export family protein [Vicinamibacterales bacterium]